MKTFLKKSAIMTLLALFIVPFVMIGMGYAESTFSLPTLPEISFDSNVKNNLNDSFLSSLFTLSANNSGQPGENKPPDGSVAPNFSDLVTGGGPSGFGTEITKNGSFVVKTDSDIAFGIKQTNSEGYAFLSKSTHSSGIGLESIATQTGISATGASIGAYGEGSDFGVSIEGNTKIGIKAESSNIGSYFEGATGLSVKSGTQYGILGIGKDSGVIGYIAADTWGALGYSDGTNLYGLYTPSVTKIGGVLTSDGVIDVEATATLSGDTVVSDTADINTLNTSTWNSSSDISWDADKVYVTGDLEGGEDLLINTEKSNNDFVIKADGLMLEGRNIQGNQPFQINSNLQIKSGNLYSAGKVTADGEIGSFYYRQSSSESSTVSAVCDTGDWLVGCSGQVFSGDGNIKTSTPSDRTCSVATTDGNTDARAYAYCFNPTIVTERSDTVTGLVDSDSDGFPDFQDNCPTTPNSDQDDDDYDDVGNLCDNCSTTSNSDQDNSDSDTYGDACDCDANNSSIYPGAREVCDGVDNNCEGGIDEGVKNTYYRDVDVDDYGSTTTTSACSKPNGYVNNNDDCNDNDASVHPGATEVCGNGKDDDCSGGDAVCADTTPPTDGYIIGVPATDGTIEFSWTGFSDSGSGIDHYILSSNNKVTPGSCSSGSYTNTNVGNVNRYTFYGTDDTTYYFRLCAVDVAGHMSPGDTTGGIYIPSEPR